VGANGIRISATTSSYYWPYELISDGGGGAIVSWIGKKRILHKIISSIMLKEWMSRDLPCGNLEALFFSQLRVAENPHL